jgi:osmoprotectant transport system ATP-binding protein
MDDRSARSIDDPLRLQRDLKDVFGRLQKTVLFVTHDMGEAAYLGDEIVLMRRGRIVQRGRPMDLLERPADPFVTEFIRAQRPLVAVGGSGA